MNHILDYRFVTIAMDLLKKDGESITREEYYITIFFGRKSFE